MKKQLPIFKMVIDPNKKELDGVDYVALVDSPAIMRDWLKFDEKPKMVFKTTSEEKRIVSGFFMIADLPIYRREPRMASKENPDGEFYVVFDAPTIEMARDKFCRNGYYHNFNEMHDSQRKVNGAFLIESFLIDSKRGIHTPAGFDKAPDGSWFASCKIDNEKLWEEIKAGTFRGFSVEGLFGMTYEDTKPQGAIEKIVDIINAEMLRAFQLQS